MWPSGQLGHTGQIRTSAFAEIRTYLRATTEAHDFTSMTDSAPKADADMPQVAARKVYHRSLMTNGTTQPHATGDHCQGNSNAFLDSSI